MLDDEERDDVVTLHDGTECSADDAVLIDNGNYAGDYVCKDDAYYTDLDDWVHRDDVVTAEDGTTMCEDNYSDHDYGYCCNGFLYPVDELVYVEDEGDYRHQDDVGSYCYWHEDECAYYSYPPNDGDCYDYHSGPRNDYTTSDTKFAFGVEVEKEDEEDVRNQWDLSDIDQTGWSRERDGSLDDGYELVSPKYDLFSDLFDNHINDEGWKGECLRDHINANYDYRTCGGHMSFSVKGKTGRETYGLYSGFFPLLFSFYHQRLGRSWAKLKTSKSMSRGGDKYSAICVRYEYIEFRVISAVPNVKTLFWRRDLLRIMAKNPKKGVGWWVKQALNENTELHQHLIKVYTIDRLKQLMVIASYIATAMNGRDYKRYVSYADELSSSRANCLIREYVNS